MVRHHRDGNQGRLTELISSEQHSISLDNQAKMSGSKTSHSSHSKKFGQAKKQPTGKKKVVVQYFDSSSSDDTSTEDFSSSSSDSLSSYYSDEEPSPPPPPKRTKKSTARDDKNRVLETKETTAEYPEEEEFVVEKIVDMKRDTYGTRYFLVKWLNYPSSDNTWEPKENLLKCRDMVEEFLNERERIKNRDNNNHKQNTEDSVPSLKTCRGKKARNNQNSREKTNKRNTKNNHIRKNGFAKGSEIRNSMPSSLHKVIDPKLYAEQNPKRKEKKRPNIGQEMPNNEEKSNLEAKKPSIQDENTNLNKQVVSFTESLKQLSASQPVPVTYLAIPHAGDLFYIKVIDETDGSVNWLYIDLSAPCTNPDSLHTCIVTEDLTGKQPKLIFGATEDVNGEKFCMVQFEGHSYVEIIPPSNFFMQFPSFKRYFEVHFPHMFVKNSH